MPDGKTLPAVRVSLVEKFADKFNVDPGKLLDTLKNTCFKTDKEITNSQMMALLVVADQYKLNPFTREIFAFEDKFKGIVPVVSIDGWARIINEHPEFNGIKWVVPSDEEDKLVAPEGGRKAFAWMDCIIYRKDRDNPTEVREYFDEVYQPPRGQNKTHGPWQSHPKRMHRHKVAIQCARMAFGFAGIYDEDEAQRIIDAQAIDSTATRVEERGATARMRAAMNGGGDHKDPEPAEKPSLEVINLAIEAAESADDLTKALDVIAAHDQPEERGALMQAWNARCVALQDDRAKHPGDTVAAAQATASPRDAGAPPQSQGGDASGAGEPVAQSGAPVTDTPASAASNGPTVKQFGGAKLLADYLKGIKTSKDVDEVNEILDFSRMYLWTAEQQERLSKEAQVRRGELEKAG